MDHQLHNDAKSVSDGNPFHWVCLPLGVVISLSALGFLLAGTNIVPSPVWVITGSVQFVIGVSLVLANWLTIKTKTVGAILAIGLGLFFVNAAFAVWLGIGSMIAGGGKSKLPALTVSDPDSPIKVTFEDARGLIQSKPVWSGTIYADGKRPTQYTGWPIDLIGNKANPTQLVWHNDSPDWVEIILDNGFSLKLSWDENLASDARFVTDVHYFLDPKFEIVR